MFHENTVAALIDFDNFYPQITQYRNLERLIHEFNRIVGLALEINESTKYIIIRLYGGWMENGNFTHSASIIQQEISRSNFFPLPHPKAPGLLRGNIVLATSLLSMPELIWQSTYKQRNGLPRLRLDREIFLDVCKENKERCPIKILERFSRKKGKLCPVVGCEVTNSMAFKVVEQKMVDIILSCDILFLADQPQVSSVIVMSDDFDFHPAVALASAKSRKDILLIHNNSRQIPIIAQSFEGMSVKLMDWRI